MIPMTGSGTERINKSVLSECDNCGASIPLLETHGCKCGKTLCLKCICEDCIEGEDPRNKYRYKI